MLNSVGYVQSMRKVVELHGSSIFKFLEELLSYFPEWLSHFPSPSAKYEGANFSISLTTLVTVYSFFYYNDHNVSHDFIKKFLY